MTDTDTVAMDEAELTTFLDAHESGVISLATSGEEAPHSLPVSYGYDATASTFYFRLAVGSDTEKGDLADRAVSFVVHGTGEDGSWRSVVATGRLEATTDEGIATETLEGLERVTIPFVDIFGEPPREVAFEFYRLAPETLTGRKETSTNL